MFCIPPLCHHLPPEQKAIVPVRLPSLSSLRNRFRSRPAGGCTEGRGTNIPSPACQPEKPHDRLSSVQAVVQYTPNKLLALSAPPPSGTLLTSHGPLACISITTLGYTVLDPDDDPRLSPVTSKLNIGNLPRGERMPAPDWTLADTQDALTTKHVNMTSYVVVSGQTRRSSPAFFFLRRQQDGHHLTHQHGQPAERTSSLEQAATPYVCGRCLFYGVHRRIIQVAAAFQACGK